MEFIDHTGHVFSLPSYSLKPIGYEYNVNDYVFWLEEEYTNKLSVNTFYIKPIKILLPYNIHEGDGVEITVEIENSGKYWLLSPATIQEKLATNNDIFNTYIEVEKNTDFVKELSTSAKNAEGNGPSQNTLYTININSNSYNNPTCLVPFYVIGYSSEEGSWLTNVLIHITNRANDDESWTAITVGGAYFNEYEELVINGRNMGVDLPKDIIKAIYQSKFDNKTFNTALYNDKIKEYLLNYMGIRGECGNFNSAINSLKWFGWGDKINISKLLKTDNQFVDQYIHDYFDINNDVLKSFNKFRNTTYVSLRVNGTKETEYEYYQNFGKWIYYKLSYLECDDNTVEKYLQNPEDGSMSPFGYKTVISLAETRLRNLYNTLKNIKGDDAIVTYFDIYNYIKENIDTQEDMSCCLDINDVYVTATSLSIYNTLLINEGSKLVKAKVETRNKEELIKINETLSNIDLYDVIFRQVSTETDICYVNVIDYEHYTGEDGLNTYNLLYRRSYESSEWMWGEGKPKVDNMFYLLDYATYDEEDIKFWKPVYDYCFIEMAYKLAALTYYYERFFLPVHLCVHSSSIAFQYFTNDIKHITAAYNKIHQPAVLTLDYNSGVTFEGDTKKYIFTQTHYVDANYNEFANTYSYTANNYSDASDKDSYKISDMCVSIPMKFYSENTDKQFFDCVLILLQGDTKILETKFSFCQDPDNSDYDFKNFIIYPKMLSKETGISFWIDKSYTIYLLVNNKWHKYEFTINLPEFHLNFAKLEYQYFTNIYNGESPFRQLSKLTDNNIEFNSYMYLPDVVRTNNVKYEVDLYNYIKVNFIEYFDETLFNMIIETNKCYSFIEYNGHRILICDSNEELMTSDNVYIVNSFTDTQKRVERYGLEYNDSMSIGYIPDAYLTDDNNYSLVLIFSKYDKTQFKLYYTESKLDGLYNEYIYRKRKPESGISIQVNKLINATTFIYDRNNKKVTVCDFDLTTVYTERQIVSTLYKTMKDMVNMYENDINIPDKLLNRMHICDLKYNGNIIAYTGEETDEEIAALYNEFFYNDTQCNEIHQYVELCKDWEYDMYLMHDDTQWYIVFISLYTVDNAYKTSWLKFKKNYTIHHYKPNEIIELNTVKLTDDETKYLINDIIGTTAGEKYGTDEDIKLLNTGTGKINVSNVIDYINTEITKTDTQSINTLINIKNKLQSKRSVYDITINRSADKFLINRMNLINNETNKFNADDIIVGQLLNLNGLSVDITRSAEWTIVPYSFGIENAAVVHYNGNNCIVSMPDENIQYSKGYYIIELAYSLDGNTQQQYIKQNKIAIQ